jgi:hypothetical protein
MLKLKTRHQTKIKVIHPYEPAGKTQALRRIRWRWLAATVSVAAVVTLLPALWPNAPPPPGSAGAAPAGDATLVATKKIFGAAERPVLHLDFAKDKVGLGPFTSNYFGLAHAAAAEAVTTEVTYDGHAVDVPVDVTPNGGTYDLKLAPKGDIKPGKYTVTAKWGSGTAQKSAAQSFAWGVLAINTTQPVYLPGQTAHIEMGVLSSTGHTLCQAPISLTITRPDKRQQVVHVVNSSQCVGDTYVEVPDYTAEYVATEVGHYSLHLRLAESDYAIDDGFDVSQNIPFIIQRSAPTRLYPPHAYQSKITVTANKDFTGIVREHLPAGFVVTDADHSGDPTVQTWDVSWKKGQTTTLSYNFKAPLKSPASYTLSPLTMTAGGQKQYQEPRGWQIAGDAVVTFVKETTCVTTCTSSKSITSTTGDTLIVAISNTSGSGTGTTSTPVDSAGNTWTAGPTLGVSGQNNTYLATWYTVNANAITSVTMTANGSPDWNLSEYANVASVSALDQTSVVADATSAVTHVTTAVTTTNADDLLYGAISSGSTATVNQGSSAPTSGWSQLTEATVSTGHVNAAYQVVSATGTYDVAFDITSGKATLGFIALKGGSAGGGSGSITFVKETTKNVTTAAASDTGSVTSTTGNTLILLIGINSSTRYLSGVSDSAGNTWVVPASAATTNPPQTSTNGKGFAMAYALNATAVTSVTVTLAGGTATFGYDVVEFNGIAAASAVDQSDAISDVAASTHASPTLTTTNADDLLIGGNASATSAATINQASSAPTSGWTSLTATSATVFTSAAYLSVAATGSYKQQWDTSTSRTTSMGIMAFQAVTVGGGGGGSCSSATPAFVKQTAVNVTTATTSDVNRAVTSTTGNTLIMFYVIDSTSIRMSTITDSAGNTWTVAAAITQANPPQDKTASVVYGMAYALNANAISTVTVTPTASTAFAYNIVEFSGIASATAVDQSINSSNVSSTAQVSPSITTLNANDLLIGGEGNSTATATVNQAGSSPTSGWTQLTSLSATAQAAGAYQVVSATGTYSLAFTLGSAHTTATSLMAFKAGTASCGPTLDQQMRGGNSVIGGVKQGFFWAS